MIEIKDFYFLPIWQDNNYYIKKGKNLHNVENYSFGKKILKEDLDKKIYYIPISFIFGLIISITSVLIYFIIFFISIFKRKSIGN